MGAGKVLLILGAILTILGTYVFAIYGATGIVGSGIGFILNMIGAGLISPGLFAGADFYATGLGIEVWIFYILVIVFIIFLASGVLQFLGLKSRVFSFLFSLFALGIGLMFIFLTYTDILGIKSTFFAIFFIGEQYGNIFPVLVNLGDLALGAYFLIAGGALGFISAFMERD